MVKRIEIRGVPKRRRRNGGLAEPKRRNSRQNGHQNMAAEYASLAERALVTTPHCAFFIQNIRWNYFALGMIPPVNKDLVRGEQVEQGRHQEVDTEKERRTTRRSIDDCSNTVKRRLLRDPKVP
ncbi:hypothetical protein OUZ56_005923 [Daphnia magna]|uniref:Uncharacterized protein n=1 Tax=Daphnia magna TaxID=35525 RepID=A0ABQ9YUC1_9CRUS|nr:hypothetical protein OUZ56_005923 [Daphnia magna]